MHSQVPGAGEVQSSVIQGKQERSLHTGETDKVQSETRCSPNNKKAAKSSPPVCGDPSCSPQKYFCDKRSAKKAVRGS